MSVSNSKARLIVLVVVLIAGVLGVAALWLKPGTQPSEDAGRQVADSFLKLIQEGHPEQAWDVTTAEFKSAQGRESFVAAVKKTEALRGELHFVSTQTVTVQEQPRSEYLFRGADNTGKSNVRIVIGLDQGTWKVDICVLPTAL